MAMASLSAKQKRMCLANWKLTSIDRTEDGDWETYSTVKQAKQQNGKNSTQSAFIQKCLLSTVGDWDFNVFNLDKLTSGRALFHVGLHLFQEYNLIEIFDLDIVKVMRCITLIEEGYHSLNPYHNAVHAADVAQAMHCYLQEPKVTEHMTPLEKMTAIVSAMAHDLDHPGVNQTFLIATSNHLAALYKNQSVLEHHHWRSGMGVLRESGVFDHFSKETWDTIEFQMRSLILATDITRQAEFLNKLKQLLNAGELDMTKEDNRHFMLQIALKCADICNPCRVAETSRKWSRLVCEEFFKQGDYERKLHLPVTPLCDRHGTTVAKIQSGFMQFVVLPLFEEWYRFNPSVLSQNMLDNIKTNKVAWDEEIRQEEAQKVKEKQEKDTIPEENEEEQSSESSKSEEERDSSEEDRSTPPTNTTTQKPVATVLSNDSSPSSDSSPSKQGDSEKENNDPEEIEAVTGESETISDDEDIDLTAFFLRRHSLPVSSPFIIAHGASLHNKEVLSNTASGSYPSRGMFPMGFHAGARRHSLPATRNVPMTSFEKLSEKLSTLKETSPTEGRMAFDFIRWGNSVPRISLSSNVLMNVNLEATRQTDAHGLNQAILSQQRKFQSEPQIKGKTPNSIPKSGSVVGNNNNNANLTASNLSKLQNSGSSARVNATVGRGNDSKVVNNINHKHSGSSTKMTTNNALSNTFHNKTVLPSISSTATNSNGGPRRHSYTSATSSSPQRSIPQHVTSVLASPLGNKNNMIPRRASLDDKPRYSDKDIEVQPLLKCAGDGLYIDESSAGLPNSLITSSATVATDPQCYYNDTTGLLNADSLTTTATTQDSNQNPVSTATDS